MAKSKEISDEIKKSLDEIIHHFDDEDRSVRDRQIKQWRRLKLLWENVQHVYYSEVAHDWRIPESERGDDSDQGYYDKPVNVYRAYLESIIAALSVSVPAIICYPDDADNPLDITTARTGDKIAELIFKHIDAPILWIHALFVFVTEGMTACYTYSHESDEYGMYEKKHYDETIENHELGTCPFCQAEMYDRISDPNQMNQSTSESQGLTPITNPKAMTPDGMIPDLQESSDESDESDEFMPGPVNELQECESCNRLVLPQKSQQSLTVTRLVGVTKHAKSRVCMEVFGGLFVKIPVWARSQADCSYLIYSYETHYSNAMAEFPDYRDKITRGGAGYDMYEQWGRTSPQYRGEHPINNVTVRKVWLRPSAYNVVNDDEMKDLIKDFPDGAKICIVDDCIVHAENASLDDSWTITKNPLSDFVHFDPLGVLLTSVQDITNDLISLTVQTIEHGIPQTFADPKVLDFKAYRDSEVIPGGIYPATPRSGKAISEGFYEVKTATLSQEVLPFAQKVQEIGQLVSGALPSLFGGQMSGSRTASEYSMSRSQALQRLQTTWKMLLAWWKEVFGKAIPLYIKIMVDDEKQVKKNEMGNFVNVFIRKSELEGKIGSVELEANENLPITWNQQKDAIMELLKLNNEGVNATLATPENMPYLRRAVGLTDYVIPGEDDRNKEYEEIEQLINSEPIEMPPDPQMVMQAQQMGQPAPPPQRVPSVEVDPDLDNHQLASDIDRRWLVSDAGRLCKLENPPGYENVLLHMKAHTMVIQQRQMMAQQQQMQQQMAMHPPPSQGNGGSAPKPPSNAGGQMDSNQGSQPTIQ